MQFVYAPLRTALFACACVVVPQVAAQAQTDQGIQQAGKYSLDLFAARTDFNVDHGSTSGKGSGTPAGTRIVVYGRPMATPQDVELSVNGGVVGNLVEGGFVEVGWTDNPDELSLCATGKGETCIT